MDVALAAPKRKTRKKVSAFKRQHVDCCIVDGLGRKRQRKLETRRRSSPVRRNAVNKGRQNAVHEMQRSDQTWNNHK